MDKLTILLTGGAGFIGAHAAKKLAGLGYRVVVVDNMNKYYDARLKRDRLKIFLKGVRHVFYKADITDLAAMRKIFKKHNIGAVCHLAAQPGVRYSLENPFVYGEYNVQGTLNLLELCREFKVKKFVFASSSSVYGDRTDSPFLENDRTDEPISLYAATKKSTELLAYAYHKLYKINCTGLRFFTVYGPWGRPDMALFKFTKNILEDKPIEIYNFGKMSRDFTYIDDIADGIASAIGKNFSWEIINLCSSRPARLLEFVNAVEKAAGKKAVKKLLPRQKGDVLKTFGSNKKAIKLLGFKPRTGVMDGVKNFVNWYKGYYK